MRKEKSTKKITRTIKLDLGRQTLIRGISQDQYGNLFAIDINGRPVPAKQATIEEGYDTGRADKPRKTTSEIHVDSGFPKQHIDLHLLEFAHLLFVDTNMSCSPFIGQETGIN